MEISQHRSGGATPVTTLGQEQAPMPALTARSPLFLRPSHLSGLVRFLPRAIVAFPCSSSNHFYFLPLHPGCFSTPSFWIDAALVFWIETEGNGVVSCQRQGVWRA